MIVYITALHTRRINVNNTSQFFVFFHMRYRLPSRTREGKRNRRHPFCHSSSVGRPLSSFRHRQIFSEKDTFDFETVILFKSVHLFAQRHNNECDTSNGECFLWTFVAATQCGPWHLFFATPTEQCIIFIATDADVPLSQCLSLLLSTHAPKI